MAVKFLDNLDLNDNQLLNARLQNLASDPGSANAGDIIYNTTSNLFKFYNGTAWVDPSAGSYIAWNANIFGGATGPFTVGNDGDVTLKPNSPISIAMSGSNDAVNYSISLDDSGVTAASYTNASITVDAKGRITSASSGSDNNTTYTIPTSVPAGNAAAATLTGSDGSTDAVNFTGTTNQTKITAATQGQIVIGLADNVTTVGDLTVGGGDITLTGTGRIQGIDTVSASTDAVNKAYVDSAVVGNLVFQGGYNAATNTPDLDSSPSGSIKKGWAYVVTADGSFFTEQVRVGDFLIAQQDAPTTLANWVTVQSNIDLATLSTVGIGNVNESAENDKLGLEVLYSNGTASVGLDVVGLASNSDVVDNDEFVIYDLGTTTNKKVRASRIKSYLDVKGTFAGTSASGTSHVFTHNLGTDDVIVQIFDASTKETVYATVDRTSTNAVTVTTAASANIRCVITEC